MQRPVFYYLVRFQYLGYRYHGWQKQPDVKTLQGVMERTFSFVLDRAEFKILASSRTDAMVSAEESALELFVYEAVDTVWLIQKLNQHLAADIRIISIEPRDKKFNIIKDVQWKEYHYLFAFGEKAHPFAASLLVCLPEQLNLERMQKAAKIFKGLHHFQRYCYKPEGKTSFTREILLCTIEENTQYQASFFPAKSYVFKVRSKGFMRNQVRLMVGTLFRVGKGELSLEEIEQSLDGTDTTLIGPMAPASGLILNRVEYNIC